MKTCLEPPASIHQLLHIAIHDKMYLKCTNMCWEGNKRECVMSSSLPLIFHILSLLCPYFAGYGTIAPVTAGGQIFFLFYAVLGIPFALLFLAAVGDIIKVWVDRGMRPIDKRWGPIASRFAGTLSLFLVTLIFYILIPAAIFNAIEDWNYRESVYFATVTLTTVGFGDFVPGRLGINASRAVNGLYKVMSGVWVWIGLALVATLILEVQSFLKVFGEWWCSPRNFFCRSCYSKTHCGGKCEGGTGELQPSEKGVRLRDDEVPTDTDF